MEVSRKLIPLVPRSIALVSPPVWRVRWKLRSSRNKCSKTFPATLRMAFWATLANTAFRSSWKSVAPILVAPSETNIVSSPYSGDYRGLSLTSYDHGPGYGISSPANGGKIHVHRVNNTLEVEWHLHVQDLDVCVVRNQIATELCNGNAKHTFAPTRSDRALPTRSLVPQSSCITESN